MRRGLTMLEVMVALLIATAGFGALLSGLTGARRSEMRASDAAAELALARSLLEEAFVGALPPEARTSPSVGVERWTGKAGGHGWTVEVRSTLMRGADLAKPEAGRGGVGLDGEPTDPMIPVELVRVEVGRVTLSSTRW